MAERTIQESSLENERVLSTEKQVDLEQQKVELEEAQAEKDGLLGKIIERIVKFGGKIPSGLEKKLQRIGVYAMVMMALALPAGAATRGKGGTEAKGWKSREDLKDRKTLLQFFSHLAFLYPPFSEETKGFREFGGKENGDEERNKHNKALMDSITEKLVKDYGALAEDDYEALYCGYLQQVDFGETVNELSWETKYFLMENNLFLEPAYGEISEEDIEEGISEKYIGLKKLFRIRDLQMEFEMDAHKIPIPEAGIPRVLVLGGAERVDLEVIENNLYIVEDLGGKIYYTRVVNTGIDFQVEDATEEFENRK